MNILVIGAVFLDIKGFPFGAYIPDGRNAGKIEYVHGGVARNVVENLGNLGFRPTFLSIVDDTSLGCEVIEHLNRHNVDSSRVLVREGGMGKWLAIFDEHGDLAGSISERADMSPLFAEINEHGDEIFRDMDCVCVQVDLPRYLLEEIFHYCDKYHARKCAVIANMAIAMENRDLMSRFDCFVCNQIEAGQLFEEDYTGNSPQEMLKILEQKTRDLGIQSVVVTMGGQGSVYATLDGEQGICPVKSVKVVDTTGAGDSFFTGVIAGLTCGKTMEESVSMGTQIAATVIGSSNNVVSSHIRKTLPLTFSDDSY